VKGRCQNRLSLKSSVFSLLSSPITFGKASIQFPRRVNCSSKGNLSTNNAKKSCDCPLIWLFDKFRSFRFVRWSNSTGIVLNSFLLRLMEVRAVHFDNSAGRLTSPFFSRFSSCVSENKVLEKVPRIFFWKQVIDWFQWK